VVSQTQPQELTVVRVLRHQLRVLALLVAGVAAALELQVVLLARVVQVVAVMVVQARVTAPLVLIIRAVAAVVAAYLQLPAKVAQLAAQAALVLSSLKCLTM
jgi:hypothetical protein